MKDKDKQTLELDRSSWLRAAEEEQLPIKDWARNTLDEAADGAKVCALCRSANNHACNCKPGFLDVISYKDLAKEGLPCSFQCSAMRHWAGMTQNDAAEIIEISSSAYRSCESSEDRVTMDIDVWATYATKTLELMKKHDYDTLPNSYGRAVKGLIGMSYSDLDKKSNLSQSYWTTRLRFKKDPTPLELASLKDLLRLAMKEIDKKFKKGLNREGRLMIASILFFAYQTQKIRAERNPELISVMHTFTLPKEEYSSFTKLSAGHKKITPVNKTNLFHLTVTTLADKGYVFSEGFPGTQFIHCDEEEG